MDKVLIPMNLWYKVLDAVEDKELRQQCYDTQVNLNEGDIDWIKGSLTDEAVKYPCMKEYLGGLYVRMSK